MSLCFTDDLLMLCHGDLIFASVLRRGLDEFCVSSGLRLSMSKSVTFFRNVPDEVIADIKLVMPFKMGVLPIKYLGVPMMSKRLTSKDCKPLIAMIKKRIRDWRNKVLSFAGRLQLISSVLSSLQVYWASLFILPIEIWYLIDRLFKNFLLTKGESIRGMASVAWKDACKPKSKGDPLSDELCSLTNTTSAEEIRDASLKETKVVVVKGKHQKPHRGITGNPKGGIASAKTGNVHDKDMAGSGTGTEHTSMEDVHPTGPISRLINHDVLKHVNLCLMTKVSNMIDGNEWNWPTEWDDRFDDVTKISVPILDANIKDKTVWVDKKGKEKAFSVKEQRADLRLWIGFQSGWKFRERLKPMARIKGIFNCWPSVISAIVNKSPTNPIWNVIQRLVWGACVYFIWQERNGRCFMKKFRDINCLFNMIMDAVRLRLLGLNIKTTPSVLEASKV
nr:hypothetical protein [Tanacetum cinerariifolium]